MHTPEKTTSTEQKNLYHRRTYATSCSARMDLNLISKQQSQFKTCKPEESLVIFCRSFFEQFLDI